MQSKLMDLYQQQIFFFLSSRLKFFLIFTVAIIPLRCWVNWFVSSKKFLLRLDLKKKCLS